MSPTLKCKDIGIRKSEFLTKTQFQIYKSSPKITTLYIYKYNQNTNDLFV